jgi:predicted lactoylglutathione lyase
MMDQRVSLITLGVADVAVSKRFYEQLGWEVGLEDEETVFFQAGGMIVALWSRDKLAEDGGLEDSGGWGGITLALNVGSMQEVDAVIEQARHLGARIGREPAVTSWGGYTGVFLDLDGHPWEIAWNPGFAVGVDGSVKLPSPERPGSSDEA